ncbi:MAG: hypothetical protein OEY97_11060 [Nitrospirota bacterium]|nr:hypothetical protein [Nitrospirota bacterium]
MDKPRLWRALERVPGLAAVPAEWQEHLGEEWDIAQSLFRPRQDLATSVPCPSAPKCECTHAVVTHSPDDIVAVCRCQPRRCETAPLKRSDIVAYEVDRKTLGAAAAAAVGAESAWSAVDGLAMTWRIGAFAIDPDSRAPVYMTTQITADDFQHVIGKLVAVTDGPFVLVAPTHDLLRSADEALLERRNVCFLTLADLLAWDEKGALAPAQSPHKTLDETRAKLRGEAFPPTEQAAYCRAITHESAFTMDADEYKALVARSPEFAVFIDGVTGAATRYHDGKAMPPGKLTAGEFAMIAEYIESRKIMRPTGTKTGTGKSAETARSLFNSARRKVDIKLGRYEWCCFQTRKATERGQTAFEFAPPDGIAWCLILPTQA